MPAALLIAVLAVGGALLLLALAGATPPAPFGGAHPGFWFVFPVGFGLFWLLVIFVVRPRCWGWGAGLGPARSGLDEAKATVRVRFAHGEISKAEMGELLRDLDATSSPTRRG
ncbi:MAG TPA: hypothetical protein VGV64_05545 [Thermoplasmata archaeon]|nr:hypothetical protein [Thermoplasmata archaeon]